MKFCLKTFETFHYLRLCTYMQHFSNYLVLILVIRFNCQGGAKMVRGGGEEFQGSSCPPTSRAYAFYVPQIRTDKNTQI